ncbi:MAG: TetR/AcrR family transcriptional regulator [Ignavibacteria bacterium]|nr:TetR/AcrR family transcriptional regulator [Ignavibacteria bacterium]
MGLLERKEREREQRVAVILKAAKKAFLKHGLHGTTMEKIASEAELAKGTLYLYFKSRDELMMTLIAEDLEQLIKGIKEVVHGDEPASKKLLNAVQVFYGFSKREQFIYRVMTQVPEEMTHVSVKSLSAASTKSDVSTRFLCANETLMSLMTCIVDEGVSKGDFHITQPSNQVVMQIIIALKGTMVIIRNGMMPADWLDVNPEKLLIDTATLIVRGLCNADLTDFKKKKTSSK